MTAEYWVARDVKELLGNQRMTADQVRTWLEIQSRGAFAHRHITDRSGGPWCVRDYQRGSLESRAARKVHCDGRDVGKTAEIELVTSWAAVACPDTEMLIATQCENHLFPVMHRLWRRFTTVPALAGGLVEVKRSPSWHVRFANGFVLWGSDRGSEWHELPRAACGLAARGRGTGHDGERLGGAVSGVERGRVPVGVWRAERVAETRSTG